MEKHREIDTSSFNKIFGEKVTPILQISAIPSNLRQCLNTNKNVIIFNEYRLKL